MKTPREILLARHGDAVPKLDAIRRSVMDELNNKETKKQSASPGLVALFFRCSNAVWRELILPSRRIWTGLATVWILIIVINLSQRDTTSSVTGKTVSAPAVTMSWQTQQRWMNELLADRSVPPVPEADRLKNDASKPRTECTQAMAA